MKTTVNGENQSKYKTIKQKKNASVTEQKSVTISQ